jgi:ribonuclease D
MSLLKPVFENPDVLKIFHGADYDIRSLFRDFGFCVGPIFDTELASRFLGNRHSGLDAVLQERFDVQVDKRFQKKDWSKRPLSDEMLHYAAQDVQYLIPLYRMLHQELMNCGRLEWVEEECERLSRVRYAEDTGEPLFLRFKGAGKLKPKSLSVLEELLIFRDREARKVDRPAFKVLENRALLTIATSLPTTLNELKSLHVLSPRQADCFGNELIDIVRQQCRKPADQLPCFPHNGIPNRHPKYTERLGMLKQLRSRLSESLAIDPGLLCNNVLLGRIAGSEALSMERLATLDGMKNWQINLLGHRILETLSRAPGVRIEK